MSVTITWLVGSILILYGILLSAQKKLIIDRWYDVLLIILLTSLVPAIRFIGMGYEFLIYYIALLPIAVIAYFLAKERYTITNIKSEMLADIFYSILEEKNISYQKQDEEIVFAEYENKKITYKQTFDCVDLNFRDIAGLPFHKALKEELRKRIKSINTRLFPITGVFYITLGVCFIFLMVIIQDKGICLWK